MTETTYSIFTDSDATEYEYTETAGIQQQILQETQQIKMMMQYDSIILFLILVLFILSKVHNFFMSIF